MKCHFKQLFFTIISLVLISSKLCFAQFGINKVQYQTFNWKYIETKHFDIYFYDNSEYLAHFAAVEAEKALIKIQTFLKYKINKRVPLIIYDSHNEFEQTNVIGSYLPEGVGGVTELFKNRVVVPYQGEWELFRHVIHHELVHAVLNDMFFGGTIQTAISTGNLNQIPIWMNEGLAEYLSQGGYDIQTDMYMRDISLSEYLTGLNDLDGYMAYRGGQAFYWYIEQKYGKEKISDLINRLRIQGNVNAAFKSTFNMSLDDFSDQWIKEMKKYYWPDLAKYQSAEDFSTRITNHRKEYNFWNSSPAISPDGSKMAYISDDAGVFGIYTKDLEKKSERHELITSLRQQDFEELNLLTPGISWNPQGTMLAISAKSGGEDAIYLVNAQNGDYDKLKFGIKSISSVNWSPDGQYLAFIGSADEETDIYLYSFKTKHIENITNDVFSDKIPVWSHDSKKIYFVSDRGDYTSTNYNHDNFFIWKYNFDKSDIYSIDINTRKITRITDSPQFNKTSIAVSSDGSKLLFVSDENGIGNIYEMNLINDAIKPKTNSLSGISQLSLSPDGNKLLFSSQTGGGYDIFMIRFPFDKNLGIDTLPLTKFRDELLSQDKIKRSITKTIESDSSSTPEKLEGYGNFNVDFSHQQLVKPNPNAITTEPVQNYSDNLSDSAIEDQQFVVHDYKIKFSTDLVMGNPGYSTYFGWQGIAQMLFSDVLGDHQIYVQANLLTDIKNSSFMVQYAYLPQIIDYTFIAFHGAGYSLLYDQSSDMYTWYRFRSYGAAVNASYPLDLFNRIEAGITWMNANRENIDYPGVNEIYHTLFVPEVKYVHDNALWSQFGPHLGSRYFLDFKGSPKFSNNTVGFLNITGDVRQYIPLFTYMSLALRVSGGKSFGPNPLHFFLGGTENWINATFYGNGSQSYMPFTQPEDYAFMNFPMPLRGFAIAERTGTQYFLTNAEFRFPLFRALLAGPLPILLQGVQGAFFFDMGGAWDGSVNSFKSTYTDVDGTTKPNDLLMSTGLGIRTILFGLPLKIDIAWKNVYYAWSQPVWLFSLGYDW